MPNTTGKGGAREGAGRPSKFDEPTEHLGVRVPASYKDFLREIGDGTVSEGVLRLIEERMEDDD